VIYGCVQGLGLYFSYIPVVGIIDKRKPEYPDKNLQPAACHRQTDAHNVV
jgi:hypothetical protein